MTTVNRKAPVPQDDFRRRVKIALIDQEMSIADLARKISRPRPSVSVAINHSRYASIRKAITRTLGL